MGNVIIVGVQWGDEGKGKVVDFLAKEADVVVRHQGGSNAGHTVYIGGQRIVLHQIPTGILHEGKRCVIASGVVVDPELLVEEIGDLKAKGYFKDDSSLLISELAQLVLPYHKVIERLREERMGDDKIGTTGRGIGPAYEDKVARCGIRFCEFIDGEHFYRRLQASLIEKNLYIREVLKGEPLELEETFNRFLPLSRALAKYCANTSLFLYDEMRRGSRILFEGAQGALLDVDHGSYPFVTSSSTVAGGALSGAGFGPTRISSVIGVAKAYTTRVGGGPFPTELRGELAHHLRERGREYGATTGRPRRLGWFDAVAARHGVWVSGIDALAITKLDVLTGLPSIKICTSYRCEGRRIEEFPAHPKLLQNCQPSYEEWPGWEEDIGGCLSLEELPEAARRYLRRIEELLEVPIILISVGFEREQTILLGNPFSRSIR